MRVLITGSKGQVGCSLVERLEGKVELLAVDRTELDITDKIAVYETVQTFKPDFIINAAAHTAVDKAEQEIELSYAINRDGPKYLAEAANDIGATILHISTDYVFPGDKDGAYLESDVTGPLGVYGKSKLAGELTVAANPKHVILRTAWVFGEYGNNFVKTMLRVGADRDELNVVADQFGGPTYAGDIADALIGIMQSLNASQNDKLYGVYHYSGYPHVSWCDFAKAIFEQAEKADLIKAPLVNGITTDMYPTPAKRPENSKLSCDKIKEMFAIEASDWNAALNNIELYKS
ncbi:dTDP-4-dehydrorhamnose reductase subunit, NAD(P)-binding, of dTDP-L-rhamnose synthase [Shewanella benthica]|uniref:dTDP-4-dehydrorhamnose reductase n=1 Tax=Shewanella benthica TaxID=43661 RepID=A0A330M7X7_9GAMM|nr:dTDP-4-dehydrorhamnose reductase [Shewanella benthica]SQH77484.1 dTDP-4-dehydrorhamnose reductase subunit, NAD(P)-binding, of dTDP-L-rhamnose synthase [Shewanella benthica]